LAWLGKEIIEINLALVAVIYSGDINFSVYTISLVYTICSACQQLRCQLTKYEKKLPHHFDTIIGELFNVAFVF